MRIIVPIKQVPETSNVKMDPESGTIVRDGSEAVVNPLDLYAIEAALQLRAHYGARVDVLTMGPRRAEAAVREAIAMGCDGGYLVTDRKFAGADTWATSYVLAQVIRTLGAFDLIVAGERATDGDTGQVGPGIASWLDVPCVTYVAHLSLAADSPAAADQRHSEAGTADRPRMLAVERLVEEGYQQVEVDLPALITVVKEVATPRLPSLAGKKRAAVADVPVITAEDVDLDPGKIGLKGSPTKVVQIRSPKVTRGGRLVNAGEDASGAVAELLRFLGERELLPGGDA